MKYFKFLGFAFFISSFLICSIPFYPLFLLFPDTLRKVLIHVVSWHSKAMLWVIGIKVNVFNAEFSQPFSNYLIVSNHLSYLDVIVLGSKFPSCFVTSKEIKASLFLGQLTSLAGCLFVDRKNKRQLSQEVSELRRVLEKGLNVTIFPEATSTNGEEVLRFRRPLFEASIASGKPILPITINYKSINAVKVGPSNRDLLCWYGEMEFFPHFIKLLTQKKIEIDVVLSEPFLPELMPILDLASLSHQKVSQSFQTLKSTPGRQYDEAR